MRTAAEGEIEISSNGKRRRVRALFDTGATTHYLEGKIAAEFPGHSTVKDPLKVGLGGKRRVRREAVPLTVQMEKHKMPFQIFCLADLKKFDAVIGAFFMEPWGVVLDPKRKRLIIKRDRFLNCRKSFNALHDSTKRRRAVGGRVKILEGHPPATTNPVNP